VSYRIDVDWPAEGVALLTFADPARQNQVCWAAADELGEKLSRCREAGARVAVLASDLPGHWLGHAWLQDLLDGVDGKPQTGTGMGFFTAPRELAHGGMVSIAAVTGDTAGGGAEIGWACDIRIAEEQATFSQPEINVGLTTGIGGASRLARLIGRGPMTGMVLTGRPMSAQRAFELGAVARVVPTGEGLAAALDLAREIAQKSPEALAGFKRMFAAADEAQLEGELRFEQEVFQSVVATQRARDDMRAAQQAYNGGATTADLARLLFDD
jgi:enoyl-CoA hydratase/carnithine racemase